MIEITKDPNKVKIVIPDALLSSDQIHSKVKYILRDKAVSVDLDKEERWVLVCLVDGQQFRLDVTGANGLPVTKVDGVDVTTNEELCDKIAELKVL